MLCENCQLRDASVHVKQSHNNQITEYNLCPVCAQEMEQSGQTSFADVFGGLFNSMFWGPSGFSFPKQRLQTAESLQCPDCGLTEQELLKNGFLGCPKCYEVFATVLNPVFQRVQGHTSQARSEIMEETEFKAEAEKTSPGKPDPIARLRQEQQEAIATEDYEKAARLRDEIKELEIAESADYEQIPADSQDESGAESEMEEQ